MSEKLCLQWNDFQDNIKSAFGNLREDNDFADVTLACEDGEQVEAHRAILSPSSPLLKNLFQKNQHQHPLVYMMGVNSEDLKAMVDFIYLGKVKICEDKLDSFLALATAFEMIGLSNQEKDTGEAVPVPDQPENWEESKIERSVEALKAPDQETVTEEEELFSQLVPDRSQRSKRSKVNRTVLPSKDYSELLKELDFKARSMMLKSQNMIYKGKLRKIRETASICKQCGKEGQGTAIRDHIEVKHLKGIILPCDMCEYTSRSRSAMRHHMFKHLKEEALLPCNMCERTFRSSQAMIYHKSTSHKNKTTTHCNT